MKKLLLSGLLCSMSMFVANAQVNVTTSKFDLQSIDAHKNYFFYPGSVDSDGNYILKLGKPTCDADVSYSETASYRIKTTRFNDINYSFLELKFDKNFQYLGKESKRFTNSFDAQKYAPVYNKLINPVAQNLLKTGLPPSNITPDYFSTGTVQPVGTHKGSKVASFGFVNKTIPAGNGCAEQIVAYKSDEISLKEDKSQLWVIITSSHFPGGADVLYTTGGVYPEKNITHYVMNRYNTDLEVEKSLYIPIGFNASTRMLEVKKEGGKKDYLLVIQAALKYGPKEMPVKSADHVEFIYIDGESLEIKFRGEAQLPYSKWFANTVVKTNDGIIVMGPAGKDNKTQIQVPGHAIFTDSKATELINSPKDLPNFQLAKINIATQKVEWVNGISSEAAQSKVEVLSGLDVKVKPTPIFTIPSSVLANIGTANVNTNYINGKLILSAQQLLGIEPEDRGNMFTMIFDSKGNLEKYIIKPETTFAQHQTFFSADKKTMYWVNYEVGSLNEVPNENGSGGISKKVPSMFAANIHWVTIDLSTNTASPISVLGDGTWAIHANSPLLFESDNELVFLGREISKKPKESELVIVKVQK